MSMLLSWLLKEDSNGVDVGAHSGEFLELLRCYAPRGTHIAFEPLPQFHAILASKFPEVTLHTVALGDQSGSLEFAEVVDAPALSGFAQGNVAKTHEVRRHHVVVRRLDDVIPAGTRIDFIKIDVEGAELSVLRGALDTIRRCRPALLFEHQKSSASRTGADTYGVTPRQVHSFVSNELGYRIFDIDGHGPLDAAAFERIVELETNRNFVAHP